MTYNVSSGMFSLCSLTNSPFFASLIMQLSSEYSRSAMLQGGQQMYHDLADVFADLAALPVVDMEDRSSRASSRVSPPPVLTDTPPVTRRPVGAVPQLPVVVEPYGVDDRHPTASPLPRLYTYC